MKLELQHDLDCPPDDFWALYFDPDYTVRLHLTRPGLDLGRGGGPERRPGHGARTGPFATASGPTPRDR